MRPFKKLMPFTPVKSSIKEMAMCMKLTRPGVLEIKGPYPSSPLFYVRSETLQGFAVNNRASTIELLFVTGFPSKIIDFTSGQLSNAVDLLTDFISQKATSTIINESRRRGDPYPPFDGKEFQDRLAYVESVLKTVPTYQEETSALSSSVQQIYEMSMQLRSDLEAMKKADAEADAITEVECEDDGCECECYAQKPLPTQEPEKSEEDEDSVNDCGSSEATCIELFIASCVTATVVIGITLMSIPYMHTPLFT
jgi:hypothetical protein